MKTQPLLALLVVLASMSGLAQGTFHFSNGPDQLVMYQTNSGPDYWQNPQFTVVPAGGGYVQAMWAPLGTTDFYLFQPVGTAVAITPIAGRFSGGTRTIPLGAGFNGIAPGAEVAMLVRGWVGSATTWEQAYFSLGAHMIGWSAIFTLDTADPTATPAESPTQLRTAFPGLQIAFIPEPSSLVLVGLSAAVLGLRRRKGSGS